MNSSGWRYKSAQCCSVFSKNNPFLQIHNDTNHRLSAHSTCIICAHPLLLDSYHNNVRLRHFYGCDSPCSEISVKQDLYRKSVSSTFQVKAPRCFFKNDFA